MAKINPAKLALPAVGIAGAGLVLYEGYLIATGTEPIIGPDPIHDALKGFADEIAAFINSILGGGPTPCTTTCTAPKVLDSTACECKCPSTINCTSPQVLDTDDCTCKTPSPTCTLTCTSPKILDVATCTCKDPVGPGPTPTPGTCAGKRLSSYSATAQAYLCNSWCKTSSCGRYCFCRDCTNLQCS